MLFRGRAGRWCIAVTWAAAFVFVSAVANASNEGLAAANEVSQASYYDFMDNWLYTHAGDNRGFGTEHDLARDNIVSLMQSYGLTVALEPFLYGGSTYYNVVGTKLGTVYPNQEIILGAHFDSVDNPGADDDASGTALVLEAARIISQYDSDYTIRFVAFDREEQGLYGSNAYVSDHSGDNIIAMLQADMVAFDTGSNNALLYSHYASFKSDLGAAIIEYGDGLTYTDGGWNGQSDHQPFDAAGIPSCLLIESDVWANPYYHTQDDNMDNPDNINWEYAVRMTRGAVGWLVDEAVVHVPVNTLDFTYPDGRPEFIAPLGGTRMRVEVTGVGGESPQPGTGTLHFDDGGGWQSVAMEVITANVYDAVFPAVDCTGEVLYYVSAESSGATPYSDPRSAPTSYYSTVSAYGQILVLEDDFDLDGGWAVENTAVAFGPWQREVPSGSGGDRGDPITAYGGTGRCYVTGNAFDEDLDGGPTRLLSPLYDLSGTPDAYVSYARWFYNDDNDIDSLLCQVSFNDGGQWWTLEDVSQSNGWNDVSFRLSDILTPTNQMRFRFSATDNPNDSVTEAAIDAFRITYYDCANPCPADLTDDGLVTIDDVFAVLGLWGPCPDPCPPSCAGDITGDCAVTIDDVFAILGQWGSCD